MFNTEETFVRIVMSNGICTAVPMGPSYLVKEVTRDPIGSFIATQIDEQNCFHKDNGAFASQFIEFCFSRKEAFRFYHVGPAYRDRCVNVEFIW